MTAPSVTVDLFGGTWITFALLVIWEFLKGAKLLNDCNQCDSRPLWRDLDHFCFVVVLEISERCEMAE